jgi:phosphohistidine phosphatase
MKLVFLRHGPAGDRKDWAALGKPDAERPLTTKGRRKTEAASAGVRRVIGKVDRVVSSPLRRAVETAEIAARELGLKSVERFDELSPGSSHDHLLKRLAALPSAQKVLLVGHEPALSSFVGFLTGGSKVELKKAGACQVDCAGRPAKGDGRLTWLLAPRQLRRLA